MRERASLSFVEQAANVLFVAASDRLDLLIAADISHALGKFLDQLRRTLTPKARS